MGPGSPNTPPPDGARRQALIDALMGVPSRIGGAVSETYKTVAPPNARAYLSALLGREQPITEAFFSASDLGALRETVARANDRMARNDRMAEYFSTPDPLDPTYDPNSPSAQALAQRYRNQPRGISYNDYQSDLGDGGVVASLVNPDRRMATTVGLANIEKDADGNTIVTDRYDFNTGGPRWQRQKESPFAYMRSAYDVQGGLGLLNALGQFLGPTNEKGGGIPVRINLGK